MITCIANDIESNTIQLKDIKLTSDAYIRIINCNDKDIHMKCYTEIYKVYIIDGRFIIDRNLYKFGCRYDIQVFPDNSNIYKLIKKEYKTMTTISIIDLPNNINVFFK